jgi:peptide/nickel transport system permease protein
MFAAAAGVLGAYVLLALAGPVIIADPYAMRPDAPLVSPGLAHPFGTDVFGRDVLGRVIWGARTSLSVAAASVSLSLLAGGLLGMIAGYFGGRIDALLSRLNDGMLAFPDVLLALAIMAVLGASTTNVTLGAVLQVRPLNYVEAARALGFGHLRILLRHVLPNVTGPLIVQTTLSLAFAILAEAALSFLGLGVEPDAPSWGMMLNEGRDWIELAWWTSFFPGLAITVAVLCLNLLGDHLRQRAAGRRVPRSAQ